MDGFRIFLIRVFGKEWKLNFFILVVRDRLEAYDDMEHPLREPFVYSFLLLSVMGPFYFHFRRSRICQVEQWTHEWVVKLEDELKYDIIQDWSNNVPSFGSCDKKLNWLAWKSCSVNGFVFSPAANFVQVNPFKTHLLFFLQNLTDKISYKLTFDDLIMF